MDCSVYATFREQYRKILGSLVYDALYLICDSYLKWPQRTGAFLGYYNSFLPLPLLLFLFLLLILLLLFCLVILLCGFSGLLSFSIRQLPFFFCHID